MPPGRGAPPLRQLADPIPAAARGPATAPLAAKLFGTRWALQSQKSSNERASAADPTVQKIQQVRQLALAVIAVYLAIFGLLHFFFFPLPRDGLFPETGLGGSFPNVLCFAFSPHRWPQPPLHVRTPSRAPLPSPGASPHGHRQPAPVGAPETGTSAAGRDGESEGLCVSLWQGCIRRLWFYGWLKPLGFRFDILDRGAAFDCFNYLPLYLSS